MDLKEFENYKGITPVPADFDEYWEKALGEMRETERNVEIKEAEIQFNNAKCYDVYFTGVNGARVYSKLITPAKIEGKIPVILVFHGYTGGSGNWFNYLGFVLNGAAVFAMDCRGQGGKSRDVGGTIGYTCNGHIIRGVDEKDPHKLLFRDIFLDTAELADIAYNMDFTDKDKFYTMGVSQGGGLSLVCAALDTRVKRTVSTYPFLSDYKCAYESKGTAFGEIETYFDRFDGLHEHEDEFFTKLGYIDIKNLAPRIKADVTMFTALKDTDVPVKTQYAAYNALKCNKKHYIVPDRGHEDLKQQDLIAKILFDL